MTKVLQTKGQRWSVATIDGGVLPVAAVALSGTLILVLQFTDALRFYMVTRIIYDNENCSLSPSLTPKTTSTCLLAQAMHLTLCPSCGGFEGRRCKTEEGGCGLVRHVCCSGFLAVQSKLT